MTRLQYLGARLRDARIWAGLTGCVAAQRSGIDRNTLNRIEAGLQEPTPTQLEKLADLYDGDAEIWKAYLTED